MGHIICVANLLEKSGRTMTAVNLAASLAVLEKKVLLVDCDPKSRASLCFGWGADNVDFGLDDFLSGIVSSRAVVKKTDLNFLDIIPTGATLGEIDSALSQNPDKEKILSIVLEKFRGSYDFILFDTPAQKSLLTRSALVACDSLLIPARLIDETAHGILALLSFASDVRKNLEESLALCGILFMGCDNLDTVDHFLGQDQLADFRHAFCPVTIPLNDGPECQENRTLPACFLDIKSGESEAFLDLSFEFLYRETMKRTA